MAYPEHAKQKCPLCDTDNLEQSLPEHVMRNHINSDGTWDTLLDSLISMDPSFYSHILCFLNIFLNHPHVSLQRHYLLYFYVCTYQAIYVVYAHAGAQDKNFDFDLPLFSGTNFSEFTCFR